ncbi:uncharacterized protein N7529_008678 [Penicillium soppii]|uniref:uncharacterized protein n=1 Tax=Penicillium soppii TaxID=69789 RepID=UPI0025484F42|nr:uncharacterized protein N7529_008678 [Penicillium soppii]KAJ5861368.1 hypothetical protein N7529_008678 [Penicillium soppii]
MEDVQATARWAKRVLRPLTSICRRIEKHQESLSTIATESKTAENKDIAPLNPANSAQRAYDYLGSDADADENDPAWVPWEKQPERRRSRRKYSTRGEDNGGKRRSGFGIHSPERPRTLPGAIEVATPQITGKRWEMPSSAQSQRSTGLDNFSSLPPPSPAFRVRNPLRKSPWQELLDQSGDPIFADIAHNLDRVFQNFLFNTQKSRREARPSTDDSRCGARSLMSMVARCLPKFIAKEQERQDKLDEDGDEDMCDAYFTELEAFYAPHGTGWKPLREAVRAQGIHLIAKMIQNSWITDSVACALIEKCRSIAPEEGDYLLSTLLSAHKSYPYPQALRPAVDPDASGDPIRLLRKYAHHGVTGRSYIFSELGKLLLRGMLPPQWMGTKLWTSWMIRATLSFSKEDKDCPAASRLIEAVILSASDLHVVTTPAASQSSTKTVSLKGKASRAHATRAASTAWESPQSVRPCPMQIEDALSNHVISLLAALCGMHISRSRASDQVEFTTNCTKASHIIGYLQFALQRDVDTMALAQRSYNTSYQLLRRGCILLATSLVHCNDTLLLNKQYTMSSTINMDECADVIASRPEIIKELAFLVRQAFRCLRASPEDGAAGDGPDHTSEEIRRMVSQLACIADTPGLSALLGRVAAEAAMEFAEATGDPDEHVWAVEVQEAVANRQDQREKDRESSEEPVESSQKITSQKHGLFRWEDSIGEWVAPTPVSKRKPIIVQRAQRPMRMLPSPVPCVPCSTDCSSLGSDCSQDSASSVISSPPSVATKRTFEDIEVVRVRPSRRRGPDVVIDNEKDDLHDSATSVSSSPPTLATKRMFDDIEVSISRIRPSKRPRPNPVVVIDNKASSRRENSPTPTRFHPTVEPVTRILRERNSNLTRRAAPTRHARKVEVVVVNNKENSGIHETQPTPERVERQMHRTMERKRPVRTPNFAPRFVQRPSSQRTIPCSQDGDSDDELSFL